MSEIKPEFATNRSGERVADAINAHLAHLRTALAEPYELAIATAYFNPGGYSLLAGELDHPARVRLLLGAEPAAPDPPLRRLAESANPARAERARLRRALEGHARTLDEDRNLLGFDRTSDATARHLVEWLDSGRVEVRRLEDAFLHGKAFIVTTHDEGVIAGSSNFTYAGLATNVELNLGHYQPSVVGQVREWFDELWDRAESFDLAGLFRARFEPHLPYLVFLRMLLEKYGAELSAEAHDEPNGVIHLTSFQRHGLWQARRILDERHGVLIADEVGLGKTFLAGELIRETVEDRRQRVLLIAPATLRDGPWRKFLANYQLGVESISFEELADDERLNPETGTSIKLDFNPKDYALVVIDEAHNLRNPATQRASALRRLLAGSPPKNLMLLTATPVNNSLWDLYHLLGYFLKNDAAFADVGIRSLRDHFALAMALNPDDLSPEHLFDVLDAVAVRRTRPFVRHYYASDTVLVDGRRVPITFPTPRVLRVDYDLDRMLPGMFDRFAHALADPSGGGIAGDPNVLSLARYTPSQYRRDRHTDSHEVQLAGLLRAGLLKRFESSSYAFARTCRTMAESHDQFLGLLAQGSVATGRPLAEWAASDSDELDEDFTARYADELDDAEDYDVDALAADVAADRDLLLTFAHEAGGVARHDDPKLAALVAELVQIADDAAREGTSETEIRDKRKVLIFSYFADTVDWIVDYLDEVSATHPGLAPFRGRISATSGTQHNKEDVLWGFAPRTTDAPDGRNHDLFDIVVATDVLAEGVNLQQARHIVNYDLPWNPMRLVQRHGRIDRIGSEHKEVFVRCVFPDARLDDLLGLEERLERKIKQAAASIGVGGEVLPGSRVEEVVFSETRDEIERLAEGDASILRDGGSGRGSISGEEYRQQLRAAFEDVSLTERIRALPWGSGSGMRVGGGDAGVVFCVRVADHPNAIFRFVSLADPEQPVVIDETLACLAKASPPLGAATERELDDETYAGAFDAWTVASEDIVSTWNAASDPANLAPRVPATMHRAAALVRDHKPEEMTRDAADRLVEVLEVPHPERTQKQVRSVLNSAGQPHEQVRELAALADALGLEPDPAPEALPEIDQSDLHVVCWLAITPGADAPPVGPSGPLQLASVRPPLSAAAAGSRSPSGAETAALIEAVERALVDGRLATTLELTLVGDAMSPRQPAGTSVVIEPIVDRPAEGAPVLVTLTDQVDPQTGCQYAFRIWWPEFDEEGKLVGLPLGAADGSGVPALVVSRPIEARVLGTLR